MSKRDQLAWLRAVFGDAVGQKCTVKALADGQVVVRFDSTAGRKLLPREGTEIGELVVGRGGDLVAAVANQLRLIRREYWRSGRLAFWDCYGRRSVGLLSLGQMMQLLRRLKVPDDWTLEDWVLDGCNGCCNRGRRERRKGSTNGPGRKRPRAPGERWW